MLRTNRTVPPLLFFGLLLAAPPAALSQSITSDRPGIGSGSTVLAPGLVHLETGVSMASGGGVDVFSIGQALVRIGVSAIELELFANSFVVARVDGLPAADDEGFQDFGVGVKVPVARGERVNLSAQGIVTAPTGSAGFTADEWIVAVNALADVTVSDQVGLAVNLGVQETGGGAGETFSVIVTPGVALGEGWGMYGGWAGFFSDLGDTHFGEFGFTYLVNPDVQLDLNSGWDIDSDAWFFGGGVAIRWGAR